MTANTENSGRAVRYWLTKANECLASAQDELGAGRLDFAVNRCYYAAFYAASAVLLSRGHRFVKHSGVRAAVHQHLVKTGLLATDWGQLYDEIYDERSQGDYIAFTSFEATDVDSMMERVTRLVALLAGLVQ